MTSAAVYSKVVVPMLLIHNLCLFLLPFLSVLLLVHFLLCGAVSTCLGAGCFTLLAI